MSRYIFSAGTARGGTGLLTRMLSVHPEIEIALDPYLGLYRSLRTAMVNAYGSEEIKSKYNPASPIQDCYFSKINRDILSLLFENTIDIPIDQAELKNLIDSMGPRGALSSGDVVGRLNEIKGKTYKEVFSSSADLIKNVRNSKKLKWTGIHENWTTEFLLPLARAYPTAKFMIAIRDPRAVVSSNLQAKNPAEIGHILSYVRSIRKMMACAAYFKTLSLFKDRLYVVRYEDIVLDPEGKCRSLCEFLSVDFISDMLDSDKWVEPSTGGVYDGLSSYEEKAGGFAPHRIDRWKKYLTKPVLETIEFLIGPEMGLFNYQLETTNFTDWPSPSVLETLVEDAKGEKAWRCDYNSPLEDYGYELFRRAALQTPTELDNQTIERAFLFKEVYSELKSFIGSNSK